MGCAGRVRRSEELNNYLILITRFGVVAIVKATKAIKINCFQNIRRMLSHTGTDYRIHL